MIHAYMLVGKISCLGKKFLGEQTSYVLVPLYSIYTDYRKSGTYENIYPFLFGILDSKKGENSSIFLQVNNEMFFVIKRRRKESESFKSERSAVVFLFFPPFFYYHIIVLGKQPE